jgi:hypothetical protein
MGDMRIRNIKTGGGVGCGRKQIQDAMNLKKVVCSIIPWITN